MIRRDKPVLSTSDQGCEMNLSYPPLYQGCETNLFSLPFTNGAGQICLIHLVPRMQGKSIFSASYQGCETNLYCPPCMYQGHKTNLSSLPLTKNARQICLIHLGYFLSVFSTRREYMALCEEKPKYLPARIIMQRVVKRSIHPDEISVFKQSRIIRQVKWCSLCSLISSSNLRS